MTLAPGRPAPPQQPVLRPVPRLTARLSWREIDVLREFLIDGAENKILGKRMYLSEDTVKTHFRKMSAKFGRVNRTALALAVIYRRVLIIDPNNRVVEF